MVEVKYLLPLTIFCLLFGVAALGWRAQQRHGLGPFYVGLFAAIALVLGKFVFNSTVTTYTGVGVLILASFWNARPHKKPGACPCQSPTPPSAADQRPDTEIGPKQKSA